MKRSKPAMQGRQSPPDFAFNNKGPPMEYKRLLFEIFSAGRVFISYTLIETNEVVI